MFKFKSKLGYVRNVVSDWCEFILVWFKKVLGIASRDRQSGTATDLVIAAEPAAVDFAQESAGRGILDSQKVEDYYQHFRFYITEESTDAGVRIHPSAKDKFLERAQQVIEKHLSNAGFGANDFAKEIGMSRAQLYRKLKASTGKSVKEFVREIRLEKAESMLLETDYNISEVAFRVGFSSPAYFTKSFHDYYGICPSKYARRYKRTNME